jgi:hypothetical protein
MGTEGVSYAWYDQPDLMHEMMEFIADFTIEVSKPVLQEVTPDYIFINEDMAMKNGPLLSPRTTAQFIFPHMRRLVDFFKRSGVPYIIVDTDGNSEPLIPLLMEAGVDGLWPLERASGYGPARHPSQVRPRPAPVGRGRQARADQRQSRHRRPPAQPGSADRGRRLHPHRRSPVPPDVSLENFKYYMRSGVQPVRFHSP